jgi:hypothetical protein
VKGEILGDKEMKSSMLQVRTDPIICIHAIVVVDVLSVVCKVHCRSSLEGVVQDLLPHGLLIHPPSSTDEEN